MSDPANPPPNPPRRQTQRKKASIPKKVRRPRKPPSTRAGSNWSGPSVSAGTSPSASGRWSARASPSSPVSRPDRPVRPLALLVGVVLTAVSVTGTENAAKLQNAVMGLLAVVLVGFLTYGVFDAFGVFGRESTPETFLPFGPLPVVTTAALVFTPETEAKTLVAAASEADLVVMGESEPSIPERVFRRCLRAGRQQVADAPLVVRQLAAGEGEDESGDDGASGT